MSQAKLRVISKFLKEFKNIAVKGRGLDIVSRKENIKALADLGLTKKNCKHEIISLSVSDYCEGPKPDKDKPGYIWVFGKEIDGKEVYIKLKIARVGKEKIAKCISFHTANYPLSFPYQMNEED